MNSPPQDRSRDPRQERVDLVLPDDSVIGWARREKLRALNLLHRGVGVICYNSRGEVYVHRRTTTKDVFPGMYDMFVGGVVARGESYDHAAAREIAEELGITAVSPRFLCKYLYFGPRNRSIVAVYEAEWDGPVRHQVEEIAWGTWMRRQDLDRQLAGPEPRWSFVPDGLEIYRHLESRGLLRGPDEAP